MNIMTLCKNIQGALEEQVLTVCIYKNGRSWEYYFLDYEEDKTDEDREKTLQRFKKKDENAFLISGHDSIAIFDLLSIRNKIVHIYNTEIEINRLKSEIDNGLKRDFIERIFVLNSTISMLICEINKVDGSPLDVLRFVDVDICVEKNIDSYVEKYSIEDLKDRKFKLLTNVCSLGRLNLNLLNG